MNIRNILRDTSIQVFSVGIAGVLSVLQTIIVARILGPVLYGILQVYRLVLSYAAYADLGTFWAMVREISFFRGKGDLEKDIKVRNITFTINMITAILTGLIVFILFWGPCHKSQRFQLLDVSIVALLIVGQSTFKFAINYLVAIKKFVERSILVILFPLTNITFVLLLGYYYGLSGILVAMLFAFFFSFIYSSYKGVFEVRFNLAGEASKSLIKQGLPICGNGMLSALVSSMDRLMIMWLLPIEYLGYYGIAVMIRSFIETLYRSVFLAVFPYVTEKYGETSNIKEIKGFIIKPLIISAHLTPFVFGPVIIIIPSIIKFVLPQYIAGISATQIIIASSFFGCLQVGIINFYITLKKIHAIYFLRIMAVALCAITTWIAIKVGWKIEGVAYSFLFSAAILAAGLIFKFLRQYSIPVLSQMKQLVVIYYPFFYMVLVLFLTANISIHMNNRLAAETLTNLTRVSAFLTLSAPLILLLNYFTDIFKMLKENNLLKRKIV